MENKTVFVGADGTPPVPAMAKIVGADGNPPVHTTAKCVLPLILIFTLCVIARAEYRHEFTPHLGVGMSSLGYDADVGERKNGVGLLFGVGYSYWFTRSVGVGTGLEIGMYNSHFSLKDGYFTESSATDIYGEDFLFRSRISGYDERHNSFMLQLPLMLRFQFGGDARKFYLAAGGKGAIPVSSKTKGSRADLVNSGYYEREDYEYTI